MLSKDLITIDKIIGEDEHKKLSPWGQSDVREITSLGYQKQQVMKYLMVTVLGSIIYNIFRFFKYFCPNMNKIVICQRNILDIESLTKFISKPEVCSCILT